MSIKAFVLLSLASMAPLACAAQKSVGPDGDPWANYQGTYAAPVRSGEAHASVPVEAPDEERADKPASSKAKLAASTLATSKVTIQDTSITSIGVEALGDATARSLGVPIVATDVVVGPKYELVEVQLKGATVQILRAATTPDAGGPELSPPRARAAELSPTEASWYDADADALVVVNSPKKASSEKLLTTLFRR